MRLSSHSSLSRRAQMLGETLLSKSAFQTETSPPGPKTNSSRMSKACISAPWTVHCAQHGASATHFIRFPAAGIVQAPCGCGLTMGIRKVCWGRLFVFTFTGRGFHCENALDNTRLALGELTRRCFTSYMYPAASLIWFYTHNNNNNSNNNHRIIIIIVIANVIVIVVIVTTVLAI